MKRSFFHLRNGAETHGRGRESRRRLKATAENLREIIAEAGIEGTRLAAALGGTAGRRLERLAAKSERNIRRLARRDSLWRRLNRWANGRRGAAITMGIAAAIIAAITTVLLEEPRHEN